MQLLAYSLERLRKEPDLLRAEKEQVERNMQNTAVSHYGAFGEAAACLDIVNNELSSVCEHLDLLLQVRELADHHNPSMLGLHCSHVCRALPSWQLHASPSPGSLRK